MTEYRSFIDQIAANAEQEPGVVSRVIEEFCLALRRELDGYKGINGDYVGEQLHWDIGHRAFFHLLWFLDQFSERYKWEPGSAREYVSRLFTEDEWKSFSQEYWRAKAPDNSTSAVPASSTLEEFRSAAHSFAMSLMSSAAYIQRELPSVELPADVRASVESICADWIGTKHDVINELDDLEASSSINDRIHRIMSLLSEEIVKLQEQLRKLEALAHAEDRFKLAYLLVGESSGNILRSFSAVCASADLVLEGC